MADAVDVLVTGRVFSDLVFTGVEPPVPGTEVFADGFALSPGGAANRAVAAARLGASAAILTDFGDDPIGREVLAMLRAEPGLDLDACAHRVGYPSPLTVAISSGEDRAFVTYEEPADPPAWPSDRPVRVAHVGVASDQPGWVRGLRAGGTYLVGGVGWDPTGEWSTALLDGLASVDALIVNEAEALGYSRAEHADAALAALGEHVALVVVTLAERGAIALDSASGAPVRVEALPVRAIDPTGAGDVFAAAFSAATAWDWALEQRLRLASAAASVSVTGRGGALSAPRPDAIADLAADAGPAWADLHAWAAGTSRPMADRHRPMAE